MKPTRISEIEKQVSLKLGKRVSLSDYPSFDTHVSSAEYTVFYEGYKVGYMETGKITTDSLVQFVLTQIGAK